MALSQSDIDGINQFVEDTVPSMNDLNSAFTEIQALLRLHTYISDPDCITVYNEIKIMFKNAAQALDELVVLDP